MCPPKALANLAKVLEGCLLIHNESHTKEKKRERSRKLKWDKN